MSVHTPGPWKVGYEAMTVEAAEMKICDIRGWGYLTGTGGLNLSAGQAEEIQQANAKLIAAAPKMFKALKEFIKDIEKYGHGPTRQRVLDLVSEAVESVEA